MSRVALLGPPGPGSGEVYDTCIGQPSASAFPHFLLLRIFHLRDLEETLPSRPPKPPPLMPDLNLLQPSLAGLASPQLSPAPTPPASGGVQSFWCSGSPQVEMAPLHQQDLQIRAALPASCPKSLLLKHHLSQLLSLFLNSERLPSFWFCSRMGSS